MIVEWRSIPGFPDYEASNTGWVRSHKRRKVRILKPYIMPNGYRKVALRRNGKNHTFIIGHLVLLAFRGPCPDGCEACHNDGNSFNDLLDNLRWDTHAANMQDASRHAHIKHSWSYSTKEAENEPFVSAVRAIQRKLEMTQKEFADYIGIHQASLSKFYSRGIQDGIVIKILRKRPDLVHLL